MSIDTLKAQIANEFGTPAVVIDLDRVERNIARVQKLCDAAGVANRPHIKTHKSPVLAKMQAAAGAQGHHLPEAGRGRGDGRGRPRRHPDQLQPAGRAEDGPPGPAAAARQHHGCRRQPDDHRGPAARRRDRRPRPRRGDRVRHGPQARGRRDGEGGGRAGKARSRRARACASTASCSTHRAVVAADAALLRRGSEGRARTRARGAHRLHGRHAEPAQHGQARRRHRAPRRHLHLQRPHDARLRRGHSPTTARSASTPRW